MAWRNVIQYYTAFRKNSVFLAICEVKWGHFKVEYNTLKVIPHYWTSISKKIWFRPFKRANTKLSMPIFLAKIEAIKVSCQKSLGSLGHFQLKSLCSSEPGFHSHSKWTLRACNLQFLWSGRLCSSSFERSDSYLIGTGSSRS